MESQRQFRRADIIAKMDCARLSPGYRSGGPGVWCRRVNLMFEPPTTGGGAG